MLLLLIFLKEINKLHVFIIWIFTFILIFFFVLSLNVGYDDLSIRKI